MDITKKLESRKKMVRAVLTGSKEGVPASTFEKEYRSLTQSAVKFEEFGYKRLHDFLLSMPDVVRVSGHRGELTYHAVASSETEHIQKMIAKQAGKKKKKRTSGKLYKSFQNPFHGPRFHHFSSLSRSRSSPSQRRLPAIPSKDLRLFLLEKQRPQPKPMKSSMPKAWTTTAVKNLNRNILPLQDVSGTVKNRIKTVLALNPSGLYSKHLANIYYEMYESKLSDKILHKLNSDALKDVAVVEKIVCGNCEKIILYPISSANKEVEDVEQKCDVPVSPKEKISPLISQTLRRRITTMLQEHSQGISSQEFAKAFEEKYNYRIADCVLKDIESGQIQDVAKVKKPSSFNKQYVLYPMDVEIPVEKKLPDTANQEVDTLVKDKLRLILRACSNGIQLSTLEMVYSETFNEVMSPSVFRSIHEGSLEFAEVRKNKFGALVLFMKKNHPKTTPQGVERRYPAICTGNEVSETRKKVESRSSSESASVSNNNNNTDMCNANTANVESSGRKLSDASVCTAIESTGGNLIDTFALTDTVEPTARKLHNTTNLTTNFESTGGNLIDTSAFTNIAEPTAEKLHCTTNLTTTVESTGEKLINTSAPTATVESTTGKLHDTTDLTANALSTTVRKLSDTPALKGTVESTDGKLHDATGLTAIDPVTSDQDVSEASKDDDHLDLDLPQSKMSFMPVQSNVHYAVFPDTSNFAASGEFGKMFKVSLGKVFSPGKFYMIPYERKLVLEQLSEEMNKFYSGTTFSKKTDFVVGNIYAAPSTMDKQSNWMRVRVLQILSDLASVFLVDIGELCCVPLESLRKLDRIFTYVPPLAMVGSLAGIEIKKETGNATDLFEELVCGEDLIAHLTSARQVGNSWVFYVCLYSETKEKWINDMMVDEYDIAKYTGGYSHSEPQVLCVSS